MLKEANVFTAVVREEGMVRKVVLELQPDGSYDVVREAGDELPQEEKTLYASGISTPLPGEFF